MKQPSIFIPHGGGPCFFMDPPPDDPQRWVGMEAYLRSIPSLLPAKPDAMLVISAHWEMPLPTVLSAAHPGLLYDYNGFPPHTYKLTYPAPGAPALGERVRSLLGEAGISSGEDAKRNYDHGIFIPLKVAFPDADIPILQLSLKSGLDPAQHIAMGRALSSLRDEQRARRRQWPQLSQSWRVGRPARRRTLARLRFLAGRNALRAPRPKPARPLWQTGRRRRGRASAIRAKSICFPLWSPPEPGQGSQADKPIAA